MLLLSVVSSRARACAVSLVVALAVLFVAVPAAAAPTILIPANPTRSSPKSDHTSRPQNQLPNGISFDDCEKDVTLHFIVTASGFTTGAETLQVWAGVSDCSGQSARIPPTGTCQPVSAQYSLSASFTVDVRARDLVYASGLPGVISPAGSGGIATLTTQTSDSVCSQRTASTGTAMNVAFLLFPAGGGTDAEMPVYVFNPTMPAGLGVTVDTVGPPVPSGPHIDVGDTLLNLSWTPVADLTDTAGFTVFCDPPPGQPADAAPSLPAGAGPVCADASTTADSGTPQDSATSADSMMSADAADGATDSASTPDANGAADSGRATCGTTEGGVCGSNAIQPNVNGSLLASLGNGYYICPNTSGTAGATAHSATVKGLSNDKQYTFGVAASDLIGNTGPVLVFDCGTPQAIDDFWNRYKEAGGGAGGTFCALEAVGLPVPASMAALSMLVAGLALARRRRGR